MGLAHRAARRRICVPLLDLAHSNEEPAGQNAGSAAVAGSRRPRGRIKKGPIENLLTSVLPPDRAGSLSRKLIEAGWYTVTPAQIVLRMIATGVAGIVAVMLVGRFLHFNPLLNLIFEVLLLAMAIYAPWYALERAVETRKEQVQKALPDFLDMISSTVRAGLSINASLAYAVDAAPGALGDDKKRLCPRSVWAGRAPKR